MAILTSDDLVEIRQGCERDRQIPINYTKATINAAVQAIEDWFEANRTAISQAIEDWFEANRTAISQAINTATDPVTLTAAQKKEISKHWLAQKFRRGG